MQTWMVRAGRGGRNIDDFVDKGIVSIGWREVGDLSRYATRDAMLDAVRRAYPEYTEQAALMVAGQLFRFVREFQVGHRVVSYDPRARVYYCGEIIGPYTHHAAVEVEEYLCQRKVKWTHEKLRDALSEQAKNSLGAISTIFAISESVSAELWGERPVVQGGEADISESPPTLASPPDIESLANEAIKDRIAALGWDEMQELVAGLLRAMGYKTQVSPHGADRGKDIIASPDGFGFQEPRIVVEVKHRKGTRMGSQEIRSFLGGRHLRDVGLYVSTGGFSKDAYYEAERASIPLTLMDFEDLVEAIQDHYASFDEETRAILPLKRLYWPIGK